MSHRLRDLVIIELGGPHAKRLLADGMPLPLAEHTRDPDATNGYACKGFARGYKLHVIIDDLHRVIGWSVRPMNCAKTVVAAGPMSARTRSDRLPRTMVADAGYDSRPLYRACARAGVRLIARRRKAGRGMKVHHPDRDRAWAMRAYAKTRKAVEHFFARLKGAGTGMWGLPPWVRGQHGITLWVGVKLLINAARITLTRSTNQVLDA